MDRLLIGKALLMWFVLLVVMAANGFLRVLVLQPHLGEDPARRLASLIGVALTFGLSGLFVTLSGATGPALAWVGVLWLALTVAFELLFGHFVAGMGWDALLADYNLANGRLWPLVLLSTLVSPWVWGLIRPATGGREYL